MTEVQVKQKRARKKKSEMTQEDIDTSLTNPLSKNYVCKNTLHTEVIDWQNKVKAHNTQYHDDILSFMTPEQKSDKKNYVKHFDAAVREAAKQKAIPKEPIMPDTIGADLLKICDGLSKRFNFRGYTYRDEMVRDAVVDCVKAVKKYDGTRFTNPFGYFSQIANYAFLGRLDKEKKAHKTKMDLAFDPNTEIYSTMDGDDGSGYDISTDDLRGFYYENKT